MPLPHVGQSWLRSAAHWRASVPVDATSTDAWSLRAGAVCVVSIDILLGGCSLRCAGCLLLCHLLGVQLPTGHAAQCIAVEFQV